MTSHVPRDSSYQSSHYTLKAPESIGFILKEDDHWGTYVIHSYMSSNKHWIPFIYLFIYKYVKSFDRASRD